MAIDPIVQEDDELTASSGAAPRAATEGFARFKTFPSFPLYY